MSRAGLTGLSLRRVLGDAMFFDWDPCPKLVITILAGMESDVVIPLDLEFQPNAERLRLTTMTKHPEVFKL
eukprot:scaffold647834_cov30-Prasinocladus_malaysianus.AAC.1